jgi:TRAP-type uncharacterized transport system substrate-binding protein
MKTLVIALGLIAASPVLADDLLITTGREGGSYYGVQGPKLVKFLEGVGLKSNFISSTGSLQNLERVAKNEAQVGIAQADAIKFFQRLNPAIANKIEIGGALGEECVFVVAKDKNILTDDGLQVKTASIAAGAQGDGSRATWDYMGILEERFKNPSVVNVGGAMGLSQVNAGTVSAFLFVTNPDPKVLFNHELFNLANNNKNLHFVSVTDWDLNDKLPNGEAVYNFKTVVTKKGTLFNENVETICMNAYTIYNSTLSTDVAEKLARAFLRIGAAE